MTISSQCLIGLLVQAKPQFLANKHTTASRNDKFKISFHWRSLFHLLDCQPLTVCFLGLAFTVLKAVFAIQIQFRTPEDLIASRTQFLGSCWPAIVFLNKESHRFLKAQPVHFCNRLKRGEIQGINGCHRDFLVAGNGRFKRSTPKRKLRRWVTLDGWSRSGCAREVLHHKGIRNPPIFIVGWSDIFPVSNCRF